MTFTLQHNDLTIELFDDSSYVVNSVDSPTHYDIVYNGDNYLDYDFPTRHAIKIFKGGQLIKSAILLGAGGADYGFYIQKDTIEKCIRVHSDSFPSTLSAFKNWIVKRKETFELYQIDTIFEFKSGKYILAPPISPPPFKFSKPRLKNNR